jgi:hypothetical protein
MSDEWRIQTITEDFIFSWWLSQERYMRGSSGKKMLVNTTLLNPTGDTTYKWEDSITWQPWKLVVNMWNGMNCSRRGPIQGFREHSDEPFSSIATTFLTRWITINCPRVEFVHFPFGLFPSLSLYDLKLVKVLCEHHEDEFSFIIIFIIVPLTEPNVKLTFILL